MLPHFEKSVLDEWRRWLAGHEGGAGSGFAGTEATRGMVN